jgi:hypothetical protein
MRKFLRIPDGARRLLAYWKFVVEIGLFVFFLQYAYRHGAEIAPLVERISAIGILVCILIYSVSHFLANLASCLLLRAGGESIGYLRLLDIYFSRLPAKYIPGGIWHTVGRGAGLLAMQVPKRITAGVLAVEQILALWWSGFLGISLAALVLDAPANWLAAGAALVWLSTPLLLRRFDAGRRWLPEPLIEAATGFRLSCVYVAGWLLLATAFTLFLRLCGIGDVPVLRIVASYLLSWLLGALAFFAPQGMGIFELAMSRALVSSDTAGAGVIWLIGSYRIVVLFADLAAWTAWFVVKRWYPFKARNL